MHTCTVELGGCRVTYSSTRSLELPFHQAFQRPDFWGWSLAERGGSTFTITYEESDVVRIEYSDTSAWIRAPWSVLGDGEALLYAALPFMEVQLQMQGFVTAHAACVMLEKGAVLLLGVSGAGKTVTAIELCLKHGGRLVGNDLVTLGIDEHSGQLMAIRGSTFLFLRRESVRRNLPQLLHLFPGDCPEDTWSHKIKIAPQMAGIVAENRPVPIVGAYTVHVDGEHDPFTKIMTGHVVRLHLAENLSRYIRGVSVHLLGPDHRYLGFVPSFDTPAFHESRAQLIERLVSHPPMTYVSGGLSDVAAHIAA